jgi:ATP-dependent RNA helicase DHX8/PRP22
VPETETPNPKGCPETNEKRGLSNTPQVLQLKALGVEDVVGFDFMDKPPRAAIVRWV